MRIELSDIDGGTQLSYTAETVINGKIAQLGSRLIDSTARKFSERFFQNVQRQMSPEAATAQAAGRGLVRLHAAHASRARRGWRRLVPGGCR